MDRAGLSGIPVEVIAVFTSKEARLTGVSAQKCFDRDGMIAYLEQGALPFRPRGGYPRDRREAEEPCNGIQVRKKQEEKEMICV